MTHDEFRRWLARQGARFVEGTLHTRVYLDGRVSTLPRHGRKEMPAGTMNAIRRQLGLK